MGMYWIRPFSYLNLDGTNRNYLTQDGNLYSANITKISNLKQPPEAKTYSELIAACKEIFAKNDSPHHSFPELSYSAWMASTSGEQNNKKSNANFLKWFAPLIKALEELGGSASPEQVRKQIISDLNLPDKIINETRGKTSVKKFDNEIAFARNYLAYEGYIDSPSRGIWSLSEKGYSAPMNDEIASEIFIRWRDIFKKRRESAEDALISECNANERRYWIYAPGNNSSKWEEFYSQGIMGIEWDEMGDLKKYPSRDAMKTEMKKLYGTEYSYINSTLATWQFTNVIQAGDIVYAKKGTRKVIGRGVVESDYVFDAARNEYKHIRKIKWTHHGEWEHPGQAVMKTLTDITPYTDYVNKLEALFIDDDSADVQEKEEFPYTSYTEENFLDEVFMDAERYHILVNLLKAKKNIILQGAPGVGKTFLAKRLAFSIMGKKDTSRVMMVQFHQSYSYEDFIMGFRPSKDGFELSPGPFYQFCKNAQDDDERDYFFIIDEINRGNVSKIFGELLMLIEKEKRGEKLRLLYSNELFSVPKNVYIIGMMNTADRSLAIIDYALRRRFAFFELEPAFDSEGFKAMMQQANNPKFNVLVEQIKTLNEFIGKDESLGNGFRIGHSYLCTNGEITDEWLENEDCYKKVAVEEFAYASDLFTAILAKGIASQIKRGLSREYVGKTETTSSPAGKINVSISIKQNSMLKKQLVCDYDQFTENAYMNIILKTTAMLLIRCSEVSGQYKKALKKIMLYFSNVDEVNPRRIKWSSIRYNRNNATYKMLLNICYLVIEGMLMTEQSGSWKLTHYIDDQRMHQLYEKFVLEYYRRHYPQFNATAAHINWDVDGGGIEYLPIMKSDITLRHKGKTLIIDTKYYKHTMQTNNLYNSRTLHSHNMYQIFTYVKNMDYANSGNVAGLVLYAKTDEEIVPDCDYIISGNRISAKTLDLNTDFSNIVKQLDAIVEGLLL